MYMIYPRELLSRHYRFENSFVMCTDPTLTYARCLFFFYILLISRQIFGFNLSFDIFYFLHKFRPKKTIKNDVLKNEQTKNKGYYINKNVFQCLFSIKHYKSISIAHLKKIRHFMRFLILININNCL